MNSNFNDLKNELQHIFDPNNKNSPECIGVIDTKQLENTITLFENTLENFKIKYKIHSVLKVNHSPKILEIAKKRNLRADVSSFGEWNQATDSGFSPNEITANGPKNNNFLLTALKNSATIVIDSIEELEKIIAIKNQNPNIFLKAKILLRLGTFDHSKDTRFGIAKFLWPQALKIIQNHGEVFEVLGFHFHIDIPDVMTRIAIFWESIELYTMLLKIGIRPKIIDIGGGFGTEYQNDIIPGKTNFTHSSHKMYTSGEYTATDFLRQFFTKKTKNHPTDIATFCRENGIEIWIEPGRSLLSNNVGFVATTVLGTREDSAILNTNSFGLGMREEELPTDPILLNDAKTGNFPYFLLGNLCLESDIIYSRSIHFGRELKENDIIIFPNMAGYHMDFYETESIAHPKKSRFYLENGQLFPDM